MRIAYLISQYPAPSHTFIRREVSALRERGLELQTFSIRKPRNDEVQSSEDRQARDETYYVLPATPGDLLEAHFWGVTGNPKAYFRTLWFALHHRTAGLRGITWSIFYFVEAIMLARELKRCGIHHLHNHFANAGANVGLFASQYLSLPWSMTLHGTSDFDQLSGFLLPQKIAKADFVACVSWFGRAQAMRICDPAQWHKFIIVRCGVVLDKQYRRIATTQNSPLRLLCIGRLSREKGHLGLLQAAKALHDTGVALELTLIGEGPERTNLEQKIKTLDLVSNIRMLGAQPESVVRKELAKTDILLLSSFMEGLPVVIMEALSAGVAVVAPRVAGIPELIEHGVSGLLFTPGKWDELEDCIRVLGNDPKLRTRLGTEGKKTVVSEFDVRVTIEPLVQYWMSQSRTD